MAIPAHPAAGIQKTSSTPGLAGQSGSPTQELLVVLRQDFSKDIPGISEAIRRTTMYVRVFDHTQPLSFRNLLEQSIAGRFLWNRMHSLLRPLSKLTTGGS
jgi:hypothetical protein